MKYTCCTHLADIRQYLDGHNIVAFDFETAPLLAFREVPKAALDPYKSQIVGVSFSVAVDTAIYVPLAHITGTNSVTGEITALLHELMHDKTILKIAHNLSFEAMFLYHLGIIIQPPCYNTIAAAQLTLKNNTDFRGLSDSGLKTLVPELFDVAMPKFAEVTGGRHFDEMNPQDTETICYACADSDYAFRLYHLFNNWFDRFMPKHRLLVEQIESPTAVYCGLMKHNGLLADQPLMLQKQNETQKQLTQLRAEIAFMIGDVDIGANAATSAFKQYLFHDLGLPILKNTGKYQEAADDETMILLTDWCKVNRPELVKLFLLVQDYRKASKSKATYIDVYLQHINDATGRIHPDLFPLGTHTGRFASRNPNLQNYFYCKNNKLIVIVNQ